VAEFSWTDAQDDQVEKVTINMHLDMPVTRISQRFVVGPGPSDRPADSFAAPDMTETFL